jgi:hypothetical protein
MTYRIHRISGAEHSRRIFSLHSASASPYVDERMLPAVTASSAQANANERVNAASSVIHQRCSAVPFLLQPSVVRAESAVARIDKSRTMAFAQISGQDHNTLEYDSGKA